MKLPLKRRISRRDDISLAVIGLGYVGLPLAVALAEKRFNVVGVDKSLSRIQPLLQGKSTVEGIKDRRIQRVIDRGHFIPKLVTYIGGNEDERRLDLLPEPDSNLVRDLVGTDVFIVCVQTPLREGRGWQPELRWVWSALKLIDLVCKVEHESGKLPKERLIVLESTTYPGTTRKIFSSIISEYGTQGRKWYLGYSPERTDPGPKAHVLISSGKHKQTSKIPRIVAGLDADSRSVAAELYRQVFAKVEPVSSLETAEMIKLVENTFRFVSIAFANEMGLISKALDLNIWDVIKGAKTKGFGLDLCFPGLIGGHCIPIDPHYLGTVAREEGLVSGFIDNAEVVHRNTKREARDLVQRLLNQTGKGIRGSRILFFGAAYKKNVSDIRESPSLDLMKDLFSRGAQVTCWDPLVQPQAASGALRLFLNLPELKELPPNRAKKLDFETVQGKKWFYLQICLLDGDWSKVRAEVFSGNFDCIVIATDHDIFQPAYTDILTASAPPIADLRNAIETWASGRNRPSLEKLTVIASAIAKREKYMLLGVH